MTSYHPRPGAARAPQMTYCPRHERGWIPGDGVRQPAQWHALPKEVVAYAWGVLRSGGCRLPTVVLTRCDVCEQEKEAVA